METEEADRRNRASRKQLLVDAKAQLLELLEVDPDQVMWNHAANIAAHASEVQDEVLGLSEVQEDD